MIRTGAKILRLLVMLSIIMINTPLAWAQTQTTGAIQGRVFEAGSLAPLPEAAVTVTNEELGIERTTVTNADGIYYVGILPSGRYRITAARQGYENDVNPQNSVITNFLIHITNTERADQPPPIVLRRLSTAQPTPTPPVTPPTRPPSTATAPEDEVALMVNITNATRGANFDERFLLSLPLPGVRSFDDLAFLAPGVAPPPQHIGTTVGPGIGPGVGTSGQFSVNGLRSRSNNFTIDGSDNNDEDVGVRRQGFTSLVPQSIESVQEFQISTLLAEPQYGRNMAAQVNAVSRSGGASYHGTIYGFLTDSSLRARDPFEYKPAGSRSALNSNGQTVLLDGSPLTVPDFKAGKNPYTRAQYGFVVGGPVGSQKTHLFASFEHQDINASKTAHFAVPTVAERGLFASGDTGLRTTTGIRVFPTSAEGDAFFSLFPFPNNPAGPYSNYTYTEVLPASADGTIFSIKLDRNIKAFGRDHDLSGRYNFTDDDTILPVTGEALFSSLRAQVRTQNFALSFNSALSRNLANQFRFSFGRTRLRFEEVRNPFLLPSQLFPDIPFLLNARLLGNITLPGTAPSFETAPGVDTETGGSGDIFAGETGGRATGPLGQVIVSGFSPVGVDVFNFPQGRSNNLFQYADTMIYDAGKAGRLTFGVDIRRSQLNSFLDRNFRPLAVFSAALDISSSQLSKENFPSGFFLGRDYVAAGAPTGFFQTLALFPDSTIGLRYWQNDFFLSDQIRVRSNFTLTLGVRYQLNTVPREVNRRIEDTFASQEVQQFIDLERSIEGRSGLEQFLGGRRKIFRQDKNNFAPYAAFAWDPFGNGKTSIRAGYGIYYDQILGAVISQSRNVFPSFLTLDTAGVDFEGNSLEGGLAFFNPAQFAVPGTLNTFDTSFVGGASNLFLLLNLFKSFESAGPGFVLPAADLVTPYSQHWGLTIEHQFGKDFLASAAYVGTRGVHLLRFATPNLGPNAIPRVDSITANPDCLRESDECFPVFGGTTLPPNLLRPFPLLGSLTLIESDANSSYHSLQLQLNKRFSRGVQFTTAYTWSHAIDEVSDIFDLAGATALPQDSFDRRKERGDASFDVRHRFVYSFIWDLPFLEQNKILGGWQLASIGKFQTGQPFSVLLCCDLNIDGNLTDRVEPTLSAPADSPRNVYRAPNVSTFDFALNKQFRFSERSRLEFRTELFNAFNHPNYGIPVHQIFFAGFAEKPAAKDSRLFIDTRVPMRTLQFALKFLF